MTARTNQKVKVLTIVLGVLLAISLLSFAGTLIYNHFAKKPLASATVSNNVISSDKVKTTSSPSSKNFTSSHISAGTSSDITPATNQFNQTQATAFYLHNKNNKDNYPFNLSNMFPGDKKTNYYNIKISYHNVVTVHFKANINNNSNLAKVIKVKVVLLNSNKVMYNGLLKDMPNSVSYKLTSSKSTTNELNYKITAYLDTSVGNEYMNKTLSAVFNWWVEEIDNLDNPNTGNNFNIILWIIIASVSLFIILLLIIKRRKTK